MRMQNKYSATDLEKLWQERSRYLPLLFVFCLLLLFTVLCAVPTGTSMNHNEVRGEESIRVLVAFGTPTNLCIELANFVTVAFPCLHCREIVPDKEQWNNSLDKIVVVATRLQLATPWSTFYFCNFRPVWFLAGNYSVLLRVRTRK